MTNKNEICKCGHEKESHNGNFPNDFCRDIKCPCKKFEPQTPPTQNSKLPLVTAISDTLSIQRTDEANRKPISDKGMKFGEDKTAEIFNTTDLEKDKFNADLVLRGTKCFGA